MPIIYPEQATDADAIIELARPADSDDRERLLELVAEAGSHPGAAVYERRVVDDTDDDSVMIGDITFHARPLSRLLRPGMKIFPYVATCGPEMAVLGDALSDPLERFWWDLIMQNAVGQARKALYNEIERITGYSPVSANPGSIGMWPISNQPALFSLIGDVESMIGVTVAPSFLMVPLKSISGILFPGSDGFTHNCCLCERSNCPGRNAPFDAELKATLEQ